jgi:hypothetical protein
MRYLISRLILLVSVLSMTGTTMAQSPITNLSSSAQSRQVVFEGFLNPG